jgi:uncharacterized protein involved in copper resistance
MRTAAAILSTFFLATATSGSAFAAGAHSMDDPHGEPMLFWSAGADVDGADAGWIDNGSGTLVTWDAFASYGGDNVKLRLEVEGDATGGEVESSELRAMLSWNASAATMRPTDPGALRQPRSFIENI